MDHELTVARERACDLKKLELLTLSDSQRANRASRLDWQRRIDCRADLILSSPEVFTISDSFLY